MLPALQAYVNWMGSEPLFVDEMVAKIGTVIEDYGPNVLLKPEDPLFDQVDIVRALNATSSGPANTPAHVILTPAEPPALADLIPAFGAYQELPNRRPFPPRVIFQVNPPGSQYTIAMIVEVRQNHAARITLRRDQRN